MCKSLKEWIIQETKFQVKAVETDQEVSYSKSNETEFNAARQSQEYPRPSLEDHIPILRLLVAFVSTDHVKFVVDLTGHECVVVMGDYQIFTHDYCDLKTLRLSRLLSALMFFSLEKVVYNYKNG